MKAFIFDLDGVIIDDESMWEVAKKEIYLKHFGQEIFHKLGSTIGINFDKIYERSVECGSTIAKEELQRAFLDKAAVIYQTAPITLGLPELIKTLEAFNYAVGIVSASPKAWIDIVINRFTFSHQIEIILSLYDRDDLPHKPAPDGYQAVMKMLKSDSSSTIILEDSNAGIASGKAAGAYTIALQQNLVKGYEQIGADITAANLQEVIEIVRKLN